MTDDHSIIIRLPKGRAPSLVRFCRKIRTARGNMCENCGASSDRCQIAAHHILDYHTYPQYAKDPANIIVLCQDCHPTHRSHAPDFHGETVLAHARLSYVLRKRIADFVEQREPGLSTFVAIVRGGEPAARDYFFRRLDI